MLNEGGWVPVHVMPKSGDDRAWAQFWGDQAINSILRYEVRGDPHDLEHVKRAARLAWWHACRVRGYKYWDVMWTKGEKWREDRNS